MENGELYEKNDGAKNSINQYKSSTKTVQKQAITLQQLLSLSASSRHRDHKQGDRLLVVFVNPYSGIPSISIGFASAVSTSNLSKKEV